MKVLILSCNTGEGHNSCAKAIKEVYDSHGDSCVIADGLQFISSKFSKFISWGHTTIYRRMPWAFKFGYQYSENHRDLFEADSEIHKILTSGCEQMYKYISEEKFDIVICTHTFPSMLLTEMLKAHPMPIKTCFVATDYTCSPSTEDSDLDRYFIPDSSLAHEFEYPTIPRSKMVSSGIPIRQMFYQRTKKEDAKRLFGIPADHKHLLMMCGSMGCGPLKRLTRLLNRRLDTGCDLSIVCGRNKRLQKKLQRRYKGSPNIHVLGFVSNMSALMDSADLYLTKPGGLSTTEAAVKHLPMVYIDAVAGCEEHNLRYFEGIGGAKTGTGAKELANICLQLLNNDEKLLEMSEVLKHQHEINTSECIYSTMKAL